jgi:uncharacterized protein YecT (DUF1311 family)
MTKKTYQKLLAKLERMRQEQRAWLALPENRTTKLAADWPCAEQLSILESWLTSPAAYQAALESGDIRWTEE